MRSQVNHTATTVHVQARHTRLFCSPAITHKRRPQRDARIAAEASENDTSAEAVAERIKASIPSLRPVLASLNSPQGTAWINILLSAGANRNQRHRCGFGRPPVQRPVIIIESPSGEEQQTNDLLRQIVQQLRALNASEATDTANQDQGTRKDEEKRRP